MKERQTQKNRRGLKKFGLRKCLLCKEVFALNESNFFHNFTGKGCNGFGWYCKECHKIKNRKYYRYTRLKDRFDFLKKYNFTCQYCGRKAPEVVFHIDHIYPISKGGTSNKNNLTLSCDECNIGKGNKIYEF
ncbi:MAG: hypothetical protein UT43_C0017G0018 [Parcubacteria group bacterium GW2011_GWC1_39_29]|uniref:HNH nuclease domain-containing protein n=1 Tax=Candidatus Yanofskybacteria bacterium GW2011_GWD1_39_16 TaxID=1619030 RepID=A0A837HUS6_9BACT|nr:MAG: hypothetical protein UT35_C0002G0017 [Candidatus Yanofskybacteria bacterium GW2011_GWD1_39_16]KKR14747.1 MAG: hypothetical protein UT43_C0017G0018 [Parcubacteria group bacterium GW2011_GWC1_39_29]